MLAKTRSGYHPVLAPCNHIAARKKRDMIILLGYSERKRVNPGCEVIKNPEALEKDGL